MRDRVLYISYILIVILMGITGFVFTLPPVWLGD